QSSDPASPHYGDATRAYADGAWLRLPFTEREIAQSRTRSVMLSE
ncbi:penicillin acylase family protein, partial [Algiphilus sp.]